MKCYKALEAAHVELALLKEEVVRADIEKTDGEKNVTKICEEVEQRMVCLNVALPGSDRAENLTRLMMTELLNAAEAFVQQLGHDAVN